VNPQPKPGEGKHNKRRRELARAKAARQAARRADRDATRRRRTVLTASLAILALVVVVLAVVLWPQGDGTPTASSSAAATPSASAAPGKSAAAAAKPGKSASAVLANCKDAPGAQSDPKSFAKAPTDQLVTGTSYSLALATNCGAIRIATVPTKAPKTVNSMLWLAQQGFFNATPCHRLTTAGIFVLQCGDPTGKGTGGPGYQLPDENLPKAGGVTYPAGTVAMANAGANTAGSQFFIVYKDTTLPSSYTIWGKVTEGLDVVKAVAAAGVQGGGTDGAPAQPIGIITATSSPKLPA
jgi:peptidyl-prolyl cis-trans isomerase B (cyclophilin B)